MRTRESGGGSQGIGDPSLQKGRRTGGNGSGSGGGGPGSTLPTKLYFRIGEVASAVGVETHVLRYWETEFRSIRPQKSSRGQRVYSRRDVETLMRVKELLYDRGFTIAGARKQLRDGGVEPREAGDPTVRGAARMRAALVDLRKEILALMETFA
jgi:DNA-binding transcriptional MerR regulator